MSKCVQREWDELSRKNPKCPEGVGIWEAVSNFDECHTVASRGEIVLKGRGREGKEKRRQSLLRSASRECAFHSWLWRFLVWRERERVWERVREKSFSLLWVCVFLPKSEKSNLLVKNGLLSSSQCIVYQWRISTSFRGLKMRKLPLSFL